MLCSGAGVTKYFLAIPLLVLVIAILIYYTPSEGIIHSGGSGVSEYVVVVVPGTSSAKVPVPRIVRIESSSGIEIEPELNLVTRGSISEYYVVVRGFGKLLEKLKVMSFDVYTGRSWRINRSIGCSIVDADYVYRGDVVEILLRSDDLGYLRIKHRVTEYHTVLEFNISAIPRYGDLILLPLPPIMIKGITPASALLYTIPVCSENLSVRAYIDKEIRYVALKVRNLSSLSSSLYLHIYNYPLEISSFIKLLKILKLDDIAYMKPANESTPRVREFARELFKRYRYTSILDFLLEFTRIIRKRIEYGIPKIPDDADVVDWVLFVGRKGICIHYASVASVLLRNMGVKSRLAVGYLVKWIGREVRETPNIEESNYTVILIPHAWTEIYIPGTGWISFDPTPSAHTYTCPNIMALLNFEMGGGRLYTIANIRRGLEIQRGIMQINRAISSIHKYIPALREYIVVAIALALVVVGFSKELSNIYRYIVIRINIARKSNIQKTLKLIIQSLFQVHGIEYRDSMTVRESMLEVIKYLDPRAKELALEVVRLYELLRYGEVVDMAEQLWSKVREFASLVLRPWTWARR